MRRAHGSITTPFPIIEIFHFLTIPEVNNIRNTEFSDWEGMHATPSEISITQINQRVIDNIELNKLAKNYRKNYQKNL